MKNTKHYPVPPPGAEFPPDFSQHWSCAGTVQIQQKIRSIQDRFREIVLRVSKPGSRLDVAFIGGCRECIARRTATIKLKIFHWGGAYCELWGSVVGSIPLYLINLNLFWIPFVLLNMSIKFCVLARGIVSANSVSVQSDGFCGKLIWTNM